MGSPDPQTGHGTGALNLSGASPGAGKGTGTCGQQGGRGVEGHGGHGRGVHGSPSALTPGLPPVPAAQQQRPAPCHQHLGTQGQGKLQ